MSIRFGVGPCVLAGLNIAKGDAVVYMDSDLQDPPEIIPKLVQKFENGVDVVHTRRTKRLEESFVKIFLTKIAYRVINISSNIPLPVDAGDFKLLSRKTILFSLINSSILIVSKSIQSLFFELLLIALTWTNKTLKSQTAVKINKRLKKYLNFFIHTPGFGKNVKSWGLVANII